MYDTLSRQDYAAPLDDDTRARFVALCNEISERKVSLRYGFSTGTIRNIKLGKKLRYPVRLRVVRTLEEHYAELHDGDGEEFDALLLRQVQEHATLSAETLAEALLLSKGKRGQEAKDEARRLARAAIRGANH